MFNYYLVAILAVLLTAGSQVAMKIGVHAVRKNRSILRIYLNPYIISAYFTLFIVTLMNLYAFRELPLKLLLVLLPSTLLLVMTLSIFFLGEKLTRKQLMGAMATVTGVLVFNL